MGKSGKQRRAGRQRDAGNGGQATAAELNEPFGVALDVAGDLFIALCNNNCVREVNQATGVIPPCQ